MREAIAAGAVHLLDHTRLQRLFDQPQQLILCVLFKQRQRVVGEDAAGDGGDLEQPVRLFGDAIQPPAQRLAHAVRDSDVGDRVFGQRPFLRHQVDDLGEEEGVALRLFEDLVEDGRRGLDVGGGADVVGALLAREAAQGDALEARLAVERYQRFRERVRADEVGVAVGADDQHPHPRELPRQVLQQQQRSFVGPVQVVERDQDRRPK